MQLLCLHLKPTRPCGGDCAIPEQSGHTKPSFGVCNHCALRVAPAVKSAPPRVPAVVRLTATWDELFRWGATADLRKADKWLDDFTSRLPGNRRAQFAKMRAEFPENNVSHHALCQSVWFWRDLVNERLGQPRPEYEVSAKLWAWPIAIKIRAEDRPVPVAGEIFGDVAVISMLKTPVRLRDFYDRLPAEWPFGRPRHFHAIDGDTLPKPAGGFVENTNGGTIGCRASWLAILDELIASGITRPALVMEDDCQFVEGAIDRIFETISKLPEGWQVFYLGGEHNHAPSSFLPGLVRSTETGRTHALIIHPSFFQTMRNELTSFPWHVDWHLKSVARRYKFYAIDPFVAIQGANHSTLRGFHVPPTAFDSRVILPPGRKATVFSHAGDIGDIIYALPTIRAMTKSTPATLIIHPVSYTRRQMAPNIVEEFRSLFESQPYIGEVRFSDKPEGFDLNERRNRHYSQIYNIADRTLDLSDWSHRERDRQWLEVAPNPIARVVFARSARYRSERMPWAKIVSAYPDAVFVGTPAEHAEFVTSFGQVQYHPTENYLDLARVIAGCELFAGNQSSPYAIAEAMKKRTIQEQSVTHVNCHFERPGALYIVRGNEELPSL